MLDLSVPTAIEKAEHLIAIGETTIYVYRENVEGFPYDKVVRVETGSSYRLGGMSPDRFEQIVQDMTTHVGSQVHELVQRHGMTMPSAGAVGDMGARVAAGLAIDVAMFVGLSAYDEGWPDDQIREAFDATLLRVATDVARHRDEAFQKIMVKITERRRLGR